MEPIKPHLEYINVVLGLSCDDFFDLMWNPANEIWQEIMVLEEMSDYTIGKFPVDKVITLFSFGKHKIDGKN